MNTKHNGMVALAVGALLTTAVGLAPLATAQAQESRATGHGEDKDKGKEPKHTVSKGEAKPLKAAQDAMTAKKYPEALTHLKEAEGVSGKTPWDEHLINEMYGYVYAHTGDLPNAEKAFEATLNDSFTEPGEIPGKLKVLAKVNYQLKNYEKAIDFGQRTIKAGIGDEEMNTIVAQSYYLKNDYKGTLGFVKEWVDSDLKKGKEPKEQTLNLILSSCIKLDDGD